MVNLKEINICHIECGKDFNFLKTLKKNTKIIFVNFNFISFIF